MQALIHLDPTNRNTLKANVQAQDSLYMWVSLCHYTLKNCTAVPPAAHQLGLLRDRSEPTGAAQVGRFSQQPLHQDFPSV